MAQETGRWTGARTFCLVTLIVGGLLWLGFPFPHADDSFFIGAALNLAQGGGLINPLIEPYGPFYNYPPLYVYLLGGYLKLVGINSGTIALFHGLVCWGLVWNVVRIAQRFGREWVGWLLSAVFLSYIASMGLRSDACGLFFVSVAVRLGLCEGRWYRYLAPFFALLAMGIHPALMAFSLPWIGYVLLRDRGQWWACVAGGVVVGGMAYVMIDGHVVEFLRGFVANAKISGICQRSFFLEDWHRPQGSIKFVWMPLAAVLMVGLAMRKRGFRWLDALAIVMVVLGYYSALGSVSGQRIVLCCATLVVVLYVGEVVASRRVAAAVILFSTLLATATLGRPLVHGMCVAKPVNARRLAEDPDVRQAKRLVVDWWALRYVFDYQIRPGMVSLIWTDRHMSEPTPFTGFRKYPDECWVLSASTTNQYELTATGLPVPRRLKIGRVVLQNWILNVDDIRVLPAER